MEHPTDLDIEHMKQSVLEILRETKREGIEDLMKFLEKSDFFTAPASTRFHNSFKGGLLMHSIDVYEELKIIKDKGIVPLDHINDDSLAICALLHDICKTFFYVEDTRNVKNKETGQWEQVPYYTIDDKIPYGHGEKSVMMISEYIQLSPEEKYAIRWHMGFSEPKEQWNALGAAFGRYPLALALHMADMLATHVIEVEK